MEILLMSHVENLGAEGDVVSVSEGYARNYLLPKKLGASVSAATRRRLEKIKRNREEVSRAKLESAMKIAASLAGKSVTIPVKVAAEETLYGSIGAPEISAALKQQGIDLDKNLFVLDQPIKKLGVYDVPVSLHPEVEAGVRVWIVEE